MPGDISSCVASHMRVAGRPRDLMQVQAAIPEPRFNRFRWIWCFARILFGVSRGVSRRPFRFCSVSFRCFAGCFAAFRGVSPFETTVEFVQTKHTDSRALAHAITHNRIIKHTVTVPRSRTSETIA